MKDGDSGFSFPNPSWTAFNICSGEKNERV